MIRCLALILISATSVCEARTIQRFNSNGSSSTTYDYGDMSQTFNSDGTSSTSYNDSGMIQTFNSDGSSSMTYYDDYGNQNDNCSCDDD